MTENNKINIDQLIYQIEVAAQLDDILAKTDKATLLRMLELFFTATAITAAPPDSSCKDFLTLKNANVLSTFITAYQRVHGSLPDKSLLAGLNA